MRELRLLVDGFVQGNVAYGAFRREVVERFLGMSDQDPIVGQLYDLVEGACSAFDNQYIDEGRLRSLLRSLPQPVEQRMESQNAHVNVVYLPVHVRPVRLVSTSNSLSSPSGVVPANSQVAVEDVALAHAH